MIQIGKQVEEFQAQAFHDNEIKTVKLSDYKGKWVVVFFYPGDFTFICPTELQELAANYSRIKDIGAEILSVSTDSVYVHKAWHDESTAIKTVQFPMIADPSCKLCTLFDVLLENEGVALRGTFIIDPDGVLQAFEVHSNNIGRSAKELIRKLEAAQFVRQNHGEVCPASWRPGGKTLKPGLKLVGKI